MRFIKKHKEIFATFGISFLIMIIGFAVVGLFPFGKNQIMVIDSWHQYYPFLQELHTKLQTGGSLFYSWNMGMGSNFILVMAYYAFSPLYILSILFPQAYLREFMMLATALKIALAGTFFSIYLKGVFNKKDYSITAFGLLYAFTGYAVGYYWNIMWLDAVALLPLIILGLNKLIREEKFLLYVIALTVALISNFYIGFFICVFIALYYLALYFSNFNGLRLEHFIKKTLQVAFYSFLAVSAAAVVLIPTFRGLQLTQAVNSNFPSEFKTYFDVLELFNNLLAGVTPSVKSGLPNIFSGFITLYMLAVFYVSENVSIKKKAASILLILIYMLSFNTNTLNYMMHGFKFPNEVPYRFAFVFSFMLITWGYEGFQNFEGISTKKIAQISFGFLAYLLVNESLKLSDTVFFVSLGALLLYSILFLAYRHGGIRKKAFAIGLGILILSEVLLSAILGTATTGSSGRTSYPNLGKEVKEAISKIYEADRDAYRIEQIKWYSTNDPTLYGFRGVSMFSSTVNVNISKFTQKLGLAASPESNRYLFATSTPLVNGLMGVKYLIGRDHTGTQDNAGYSLWSKTEKVSVYKNHYPLPLGFVVDYGIYSWNNTDRSPFNVQEDYVAKAIGKKVALYDPVPISAESYTNLTRRTLEGIRYGYKNDNASEVGSATLTFHAPEKKQMYIYMFANRSYKTNVTVNENKIEYETRRGLIIDLGVLEKDTPITLEFETQAARDGYFNLEVVTFDEEAYSAVHSELADEPLKITTFKDTKIVGTVTAKRDGILYTSIPYEPGWTAKVDGQKVIIDPIQNAMIAFQVEQGTHEIELTYIPAGFLSGLFISLVAWIVIAVLYKAQKKNNHAEASLEVEDAPIAEITPRTEGAAQITDSSEA